MVSRKAGSPPARAARRSSSAALAAIFGVAAAAIGAFAASRVLRAKSPGSAEHAAPELAKDQPRPGAADRAPDAFRPDPTAPVPASERAGLAPATGPSPTLVADRGGIRSEPATSA